MRRDGAADGAVRYAGGASGALRRAASADCLPAGIPEHPGAPSAAAAGKVGLRPFDLADLKEKQGLYAHAHRLLLRHDGRDADQQFPCLACKQPRRRQHGARRRAVFDGRFGAAVSAGVRTAAKEDEQRENSADLDHLYGGQATADPRVRFAWDAAGRAAGADAGLRPVLPGLGLFCQRIR